MMTKFNLIGMLNSAAPKERPLLLAKTIERFIRELLDVRSEEQIDHDAQFAEIGMDSITSVKLSQLLNDSVGKALEIKSSEIFDHPTINQLSAHLAKGLDIEGD